MKSMLWAVAVMVLAMGGPALAASNLIGDPDFNQPLSKVLNATGTGYTGVMSDTAWTASTFGTFDPPNESGATTYADDSDGDPLGYSGSLARWVVSLHTFVAGDPNDDADTIQFQLDHKRIGGTDYPNVRVQIRGVNGTAPTSTADGVALGTLGPTSMFSNQNYTFGVNFAGDTDWHTSDLLTFAVAADYDYYIVRVGAGARSGGTEPEYDLTRVSFDDVFFGIEGYEEEPELFPGDADESGTVDLADLAILATNWNTIGGATWGMGDFTGEGNVDLSDLAILATNWNQSAPVALAAAELGLPAIPEPATLSLLGLGALALIRRKR